MQGIDLNTWYFLKITTHINPIIIFYTKLYHMNIKYDLKANIQKKRERNYDCLTITEITINYQNLTESV